MMACMKLGGANHGLAAATKHGAGQTSSRNFLTSNAGSMTEPWFNYTMRQSSMHQAPVRNTWLRWYSIQTA